MMALLVYSFSITLLLVITLPHIACHLLRYWFRLDILTLKTYHITHFKSFLLKMSLNSQIWGVSDFILSIPDIKIKFDLKLFRVVIQMNSLEAFFVHNDYHLHPVDVIDGLMEPNLVANLLHFILKGTKFEEDNTQKLTKLYGHLIRKSMHESRVRQKKQEELKQTVKKSKTTTILQGGFHFIVMMIFQFLEVRFNDNTVNFVSSIPKPPQVDEEQAERLNSERKSNFNKYKNHDLVFKTPGQRKSSLLLLRNLAEQTLKVSNLSTKVAVINHFQEEIQLICPRFEIINWSHPSEYMLRGCQFFLGIKIPFTLEISESLKCLQYGIQVQSLDFSTVPMDYELVMQVIKSFRFSLQNLQNLFVQEFIEDNLSQLADSTGTDQILSQETTVTVEISKVNLVMKSLYEMNLDEKDAQEYLSNISEARFTLTDISFKSKQFKIAESILKIKKFCNLPIKKQKLPFSQVSETAMILIPEIVFTFYDRETRVSHNPTELYCGRQELALLGKLFRLINERMRFDELSGQFYLKLFRRFVEFQHQKLVPEAKRSVWFKGDKSQGKGEQVLVKGNSLKDVNLVELFSYICFIEKPDSASKALLQPPERKPSQQNDLHTSRPKSQQYQPLPQPQTNQFIYEPSSLTFRLLIENLEHTLYLPNCSYRQVIKQEEFQHILSIPSLELVYHQAKEFGVRDLKMIFRQIPTLNEFALFVETISMAQNQETLVEYLSGWILIKKLLQITVGESGESTDDKQETVVTVNKKLSKKTIVIRKLELDYEKERISIGKIQLEKTTLPNDKTIKMYLSLDRCEFSTKLMKSTGYGLKRAPSTNSHKYPNHSPQQGQSNIASNPTLTKSNPTIAKSKFQGNNRKKDIPLIPQEKNYTQVMHTLLSFQSLTVNVKLQNFTKLINNHKSFNIQREKSLIHLKNPLINLPYFDISQKISIVLQTYVSLKPHISAYIKDKTQNQFIQIQRNIKDFLIEPQCLHLKITNFSVNVEQQPLNTHLQNYARFGRDFIAKNNYKHLHKISQIQVISFLKKNKRQSKLCQLTIKQIECQIQPLKYLSNNSKDSVDDWIRQFKKSMEFHNKDPNNSKTIDNREIRLRRVEGSEYRFGIKSLDFSIRDYPDSIVSLNHVGFKIGCIKTSNIFNLKNYFFNGELKFGKMTVNGGLNMLSGFLEIRKKVISYMEVFDKFEKTTDFTQNIKNATLKKKHSLLQEKLIQLSYQPWWYILLNSSHWQFCIFKQPTIVKLYTGTTPYEKQCFETVLGCIECRSERENTVLKIAEMKIKLFESKILQLQSICTELVISHDGDRGYNLRIEVFASNAGRVILSQSTVQYLSTLKQLRNDWLIIYGLHTENAYEDDQMLRKKQRMNYIELINFTANKMIEHDDRHVAFLSAISEIQFRVKIQEFNLVLTNLKQGVELGIQEFRVHHQIRTVKHIKNQWQTLKSILQVDRIWGNIQKDPTQYDFKHQRLTEHLKENEENVFLAARKLKLNFNQYKLLREGISIHPPSKNPNNQRQVSQVVFIRKFMQLQSIKFAMSIKIKKSIQKLIVSYSPEKLKKQFEQKGRKLSASPSLSSVEKFKQAVWKVVRINKLHRRKMFGIKHFMFFAEVGKIEAVLMSGKSSVVIDSGEMVRVNVAKVYNQEDRNFASPITQLVMKMRNVEINLTQSSQSDIVNLLNKSAHSKQKSEQKKLTLSRSESIELLMELRSDESCSAEEHSMGKLTLSNGQIELTQKTKSILIEMVDFLVQFTSDKEKQRLDFRKAHEKFNELQNNGRGILKENIHSAYKSIVGEMKEKLAFKWIFQLRDTSIQLIIPVQEKVKFSLDSVSFFTISKPFAKIDSKVMSCHLNFFTNDKIERTFQVNDLTIENLLEKESSMFRKIVSMNHSDNLALYMTVESYELTPLSSIVWEYYDSIKIHVNPIKFRVTDKLYEKFYQFLFPEESVQKAHEKALNATDTPESYQQRFIPDYIQKIQMDDIKVQVWFETASLLKRMEGISVGLNAYKLEHSFSTKKELFDDWIKFVLKQMAGQIFNVLGQKIFGSVETVE